MPGNSRGRWNSTFTRRLEHCRSRPSIPAWCYGYWSRSGTPPETASRVRGRIETVLDWAKVRGYRSGENPARWRGHLEIQLPKKSKVRQVVHLAALPYRETGAFMAELPQHDDAGARALELLILTAGRSKEVLQAPWREFDPQPAVDDPRRAYERRA